MKEIVVRRGAVSDRQPGCIDPIRIPSAPMTSITPTSFGT
jgi:hypothetical protein